MARKPRASEVALQHEYFDYLESVITRAEFELCGVWYNRLGAQKHADGLLGQWDMFRRPWHHVERYASEELVTYRMLRGWITFTEYREQRRQENRDSYAAYLDSREIAA